MQPDSGQTRRGLQDAQPYEMSRIQSAGEGEAALGAGIERGAQNFMAGRAQALQQQLQMRELQMHEARNAAHIQVQQLQAMEMQQRMALLGSEEQLHLMRAQRRQADAAAAVAESQAKKVAAESEPGYVDYNELFQTMARSASDDGNIVEMSGGKPTVRPMTPDEMSRRGNGKADAARAQLGRGLVSDLSDQIEAMMGNPSEAARTDVPGLRKKVEQLVRAAETGGSYADVLRGDQPRAEAPPQQQLPPAPVTRYQPSEADMEAAWRGVGDDSPLASVPRGMVNGYVMDLLKANGVTPADASDLAGTYKAAANRLVERLRRDPGYLQRIYPGAPEVRIAPARATRQPSHSDEATMQAVRSQMEAARNQWGDFDPLKRRIDETGRSLPPEGDKK